MTGDGLERLRPWIGRWTGSGSGSYPTIEPFDYDETTTLLRDVDEPQIRYEQRTVTSPTGEPSHRESGFVRVLDDGSVQLNTAHQGGRVEVMRGRLVVDANGLRIEFVSMALGNDERMVASERTWTLRGNTWQYEVRMATRTTPEPRMTRHLTALLQRVR